MKYGLRLSVWRRGLGAIPYRGRAHARRPEADPHLFPLTVEVIDREGALAPVLDEWRRLAVARGNAFLTPEWYLAALNMPSRRRGSRGGRHAWG